MTEEEWDTTLDPEPMLNTIRGQRNARMMYNKSRLRLLRLVAAACCQRLAFPAFSEFIGYCVDVAERLADGDKTAMRQRTESFSTVINRFDSMFSTGVDSNDSVAGNASFAVCHLLQHDREFNEDDCICSLKAAIRAFNIQDSKSVEYHRRVQADLVRDIFGNPFRPVVFDPRWRTSDSVGVARGIYEDRAFERMPILADALMDAGCDDEQVLGHCRGAGPHVRGCWVVDSALGKE
jgi:hypothetical protein